MIKPLVSMTTLLCFFVVHSLTLSLAYAKGPRVVPCHRARGKCIQYSKDSHDKLLKALIQGKGAVKKVKLYEKLQPVRKAVEKVRKQKDLLFKERVTLWSQERGLWKKGQDNLLEQKKVLVAENGRLGRRVTYLEKQVDSLALLKQPGFWITSVVCIVVGVGVGIGLAQAFTPVSK